MKETARALRLEDPQKNTQQRIAGLLGVAQPTVQGWLSTKSATIIGPDNSCEPPPNDPPDARVEIPQQHRPVILERIEAGETLHYRQRSASSRRSFISKSCRRRRASSRVSPRPAGRLPGRPAAARAARRCRTWAEVAA